MESKYLKYKKKYIKLKGGAEKKIVEEFYAKSIIDDKCENGYFNTAFFDTAFIERLCMKIFKIVEADINPNNCIKNLLTEFTKFKNNEDSKFTEYFFNDIFQDLNEDFKKNKPKKKSELILRINELFNVSYKRIFDSFSRIDEKGGDFFITKICNKIDNVFNIYFINNQMKKYKNLFTDGIGDCKHSVFRLYCNNLLLNPVKYLNSFNNPKIELIKNKDLICLEGNRLYVDNSCKVASGTITSCLFMVLFFSNKTCLISHFNKLITNNLPDFNNKIDPVMKYDYTYDNCFQKIKLEFKDELKLLNKIFIGGIIDNYNIDPLEDKSFKSVDGTSLEEYDKDSIFKKLEITVSSKIILKTHKITEDKGYYIVTDDTIYYIN